jgi:hypothetical protein
VIYGRYSLFHFLNEVITDVQYKRYQKEPFLAVGPNKTTFLSAVFVQFIDGSCSPISTLFYLFLSCWDILIHINYCLKKYKQTGIAPYISMYFPTIYMMDIENLKSVAGSWTWSYTVLMRI